MTVHASAALAAPLAFAAPALATDRTAPAIDSSSGEVSDVAVGNCLFPVAGETKEGDVVKTGAECSEANSVVMVGVGSSRAPWRRLVANDGTVQEVEFAGSGG